MQSTSPAVAAPGPDWRNALDAELDINENVLATVEVDIDEAMHFNAGALALTDRRLLACMGGTWSGWQLADGMVLRHGDHAGIGTLELLDRTGRLASWRFTLAQQRAALAFVARFERLQSGEPAVEEAASDDDEADEDDTRPPSTWVLLRLARFARPYRKQLAIGFALTLGSTAATLVPP